MPRGEFITALGSPAASFMMFEEPSSLLFPGSSDLLVGFGVGSRFKSVGVLVGCVLGCEDGRLEGCTIKVGTDDGAADGFGDGMEVGTIVGCELIRV